MLEPVIGFMVVVFVSAAVGYIVSKLPLFANTDPDITAPLTITFMLMPILFYTTLFVVSLFFSTREGSLKISEKGPHTYVFFIKKAGEDSRIYLSRMSGVRWVLCFQDNSVQAKYFNLFYDDASFLYLDEGGKRGPSLPDAEKPPAILKIPRAGGKNWMPGPNGWQRADLEVTKDDLPNTGQCAGVRGR